MTDLFKRAATYDLPLTKGDDLTLRFVYKQLVVDDNGEPVLDVNGKWQFVVTDFPDGAAVNVEIDTKPTPLVLDATISGPNATVQEPYTTMDTIPARIPWRVKVAYAEGMTKVGARGKTVRDD